MFIRVYASLNFFNDINCSNEDLGAEVINDDNFNNDAALINQVDDGKSRSEFISL